MSNRTLLRSPLLRIGAIGLLLASGCAAQDATRPRRRAPRPPRSPAAPAEPIELVITAIDHAFELPGSLPAGRYDFTLVNEGEQRHQAQFYKLAEGVSFEEFPEEVVSDPGFREGKGGMPGGGGEMVVGAATGVPAPVSPGRTATERGELEPGVYAVACFLADLVLGEGESSGLAHHALGMLAELTVT